MRARLFASPVLQAVLLTAVLLAVFTAARAARLDADSSRFVVAGDVWADPDEVPEDLAVLPDSTGYDGQFVYRLARDPLTDEAVDDGIRLDVPAYRAQRVATPALAWLVDRLPGTSTAAALLIVNALALGLAGLVGADLARSAGRDPRLGVLLALAPPLVVSYARDLNEPVAWAAMLTGLRWWLRDERAPAVLAFCVAVLARETSLAPLAGLGVWQLVRLWRMREQRRDAGAAAAWLLVPLAVALAWQARLTAVWDAVPVRSAPGSVGTPFVGVARTIFDDAGSGWTDFSYRSLLEHLWLGERVLLVAFLALVAVVLVRRLSSLRGDLGFAWLGAAYLPLGAGGWSHDLQFLRFATEAVGIGLLVLLGTRGRATWVALGGTALLSVVVGVEYVIGP